MGMYSEEVLQLAQTFLTLNAQQSRAFLSVISRDQCNLIRMSVYNVLLNTALEITDTDRVYLRKHSYTLRKLASRRFCLSDKKTILTKKVPLIRLVFKLVLQYIESERAKLV